MPSQWETTNTPPHPCDDDGGDDEGQGDKQSAMLSLSQLQYVQCDLLSWRANGLQHSDTLPLALID